jgi:hypothetical protein
MTLTINLDQALAVQLRKKAAARQLSVEEFAVRLLGEAVGQLEEMERWEQQNQRRLGLIRKSATTQLSAQEETELDALQSVLDRRLEPMDDRLLLAELDRMKKAVAALPHDSQQ